MDSWLLGTRRAVTNKPGSRQHLCSTAHAHIAYLQPVGHEGKQSLKPLVLLQPCTFLSQSACTSAQPFTPLRVLLPVAPEERAGSPSWSALPGLWPDTHRHLGLQRCSLSCRLLSQPHWTGHSERIPSPVCKLSRQPSCLELRVVRSP